MSAMAFPIISILVFYSTVYSGTDRRKHQIPHHWPLWGKFTGNLWIPHTKGQWRGKPFHLMTSSCHKDIPIACPWVQDIKNNAWVTVNNDFFVTSEAIRQWFSRVTKSRVKIIAESPHEWQKIVIHSNECIILFLTRYLMSWTLNSAKSVIDRWFRRCR